MVFFAPRFALFGNLFFGIQQSAFRALKQFFIFQIHMFELAVRNYIRFQMTIRAEIFNKIIGICKHFESLGMFLIRCCVN